MFAYTDCIPQVRDELLKSIFPPSLMAELALTPAGDKGNSHCAAWHWGTSSSGRHCSLGFHGPQREQRWPISVTAADTWAAPVNCWNYRWPGGFLQKTRNAWERLKLVQSSSLGNVVESISSTVLEGILAWSHWASKFQCLQYCRIWAKQGYIPTWQFLFQLQACTARKIWWVWKDLHWYFCLHFLT